VTDHDDSTGCKRELKDGFDALAGSSLVIQGDASWRRVAPAGTAANVNDMGGYRVLDPVVVDVSRIPKRCQDFKPQNMTHLPRIAVMA